ncbi:MAG: PIN domain-containing protein [Proteobacteria bacterium]|nr:PIN domain-containing protein [Pseudomonadota bacterium]
MFQQFKRDKNRRAVISTQILQEFYVTCVEKLGIEPLLVKGYMSQLEKMEIIQITPILINLAIDTSIMNKLSFWDSLVVTAAASAKCDTLLTEDLNDRRQIDGLKIKNPYI